MPVIDVRVDNVSERTDYVFDDTENSIFRFGGNLIFDSAEDGMTIVLCDISDLDNFVKAILAAK